MILRTFNLLRLQYKSWQEGTFIPRLGQKRYQANKDGQVLSRLGQNGKIK